MKAVPRSVAAKDAVRSSNTSVRVSACYGAASKKDSLLNFSARTALNVASLTLLAAFTYSRTAVILVFYIRLH
jgi:hypothetical protein